MSLRRLKLILLLLHPSVFAEAALLVVLGILQFDIIKPSYDRTDFRIRISKLEF